MEDDCPSPDEPIMLMILGLSHLPAYRAYAYPKANASGPRVPVAVPPGAPTWPQDTREAIRRLTCGLAMAMFTVAGRPDLKSTGWKHGDVLPVGRSQSSNPQNPPPCWFHQIGKNGGMTCSRGEKCNYEHRVVSQKEFEGIPLPRTKLPLTAPSSDSDSEYDPLDWRNSTRRCNRSSRSDERKLIVEGPFVKCCFAFRDNGKCPKQNDGCPHVHMTPQEFAAATKKLAAETAGSPADPKAKPKALAKAKAKAP